MFIPREAPRPRTTMKRARGTRPGGGGPFLLSVTQSIPIINNAEPRNYIGNESAFLDEPKLNPRQIVPPKRSMRRGSGSLPAKFLSEGVGFVNMNRTAYVAKRSPDPLIVRMLGPPSTMSMA